jgi:hypothetical protein
MKVLNHAIVRESVRQRNATTRTFDCGNARNPVEVELPGVVKETSEVGNCCGVGLLQ